MKARLAHLLRMLGFDFSYHPSVLDHPPQPAPPVRDPDAQAALERLGYVECRDTGTDDG